MATTAPIDTGVEPGEKGLKQNAIGFLSSCVIGVASTAPGYSLAAVLGFVALEVGVQAPAIMWLAFLPILFIAAAYYYMNRADPDCGTTFTWGTRALGPQAGWLGGWAIIVADIVVMANLAQIAGLYTVLLFDSNAEPSTTTVTAIGVVWIAVMTAIVVIGIELSARTQWFLLGAEYVILVVFAVVALVKVYTQDIAGSIDPSLSWFSPFEIDSTGALTAGILLAIFIYWGWDSGVSVNEETQDRRRAPGLAAIVSTLFLVFIYILVATAATAFAGPEALGENSDDALSFLGTGVFGGTFDILLILAVLTSAAASTQTTILPTARTTLSMARRGAIPAAFGRIHPRFRTPHVSTILMGVASIAWYVGLTIASEDILFDSIAALGLMIAFYYGLTGFACAVYYRRELTKSVKNFVLIGLAPVAGGTILTWVFIKSAIDLSDPANSESGDSWLGLGPPLFIGIFFLVLGIVLMVWRWAVSPSFFRSRRETVDPKVLEPAEDAR